MAWIDHIKDIFDYTPIRHSFEKELTAYLMTQPSLRYDEVTCRRTVHDLLSMDEDLLEIVRHLVLTGRADTDCAVEAGGIPLAELIDRYGYHPVSAVLLCQMYRREPMKALQFLVMHDSISADTALFDT